MQLSPHTFIVSDIHVTTAEPLYPKDPLWRKYKQKMFFVDNAFEKFLEEICTISPDHPIELILAGDIFDFDGVYQLPKKHRFKVSLLEKLRGLNTEERKSRYKMKMIIEDHPVFLKALGNFVSKGHKAIFIIGNHDLELHWPSVQRQIVLAMNISEEFEKNISFNNFFYISGKDTLIEHGNQHDSHSNCQNPINPKIKGFKKERIRLPFGCFANRYMLGGMGYFNPHSDRTYIMSATEYLKFLFFHVLRKEPFLIWTWFSGALATLIASLKESIAIDVKDPLAVEDQIEAIALKANASPRMVRELKEVHAPAAYTDPMGIMRELWLDRAFGVFLMLFVGFQLLSFLNIVWHISYWWIFPIFLIFLPFFIFYFRSFKSKILVDVKFYERAVSLGAKITKVKRVVYGHTHEFVHANFEGIEYLNSGTWSPAFDDIECKKPSCPKTFVWIKPSETDVAVRTANVYEWTTQNTIKLLC